MMNDEQKTVRCPSLKRAAPYERHYTMNMKTWVLRNAQLTTGGALEKH